MREGDEPSGSEEGASTGLDEFLCEYVDGTMDPAVRAAFEEYLRLNPDLYAHVECLRETRSMLCRYGCRLRAPEALQQRLRERLGEEMLGEPPVLPAVADRLTWIAGLSSVVLLLIGFLTADALMQPDAADRPVSVTVSESDRYSERPPLRSLMTEPSRSTSAVLTSPTFSWRGRSRLILTSGGVSGYDSIATPIGELRPLLTSASLP